MCNLHLAVREYDLAGNNPFDSCTASLHDPCDRNFVPGFSNRKNIVDTADSHIDVANDNLDREHRQVYIVIISRQIEHNFIHVVVVLPDPDRVCAFLPIHIDP